MFIFLNPEYSFNKNIHLFKRGRIVQGYVRLTHQIPIKMGKPLSKNSQQLSYSSIQFEHVTIRFPLKRKCKGTRILRSDPNTYWYINVQTQTKYLGTRILRVHLRCDTVVFVQTHICTNSTKKYTRILRSLQLSRSLSMLQCQSRPSRR